MAASRLSLLVLVLYGAMVFIGLALAVQRLSISMEMPGLAAIELLVLALPWSLVLGQPPIAQAPLAVAAGVLLLGLLANAVLLVILVRGAEALYQRLAGDLRTK
jgi:hypothetical protein